MISIVIKFGFILTMFGFWCFITYWVVTSSLKVWAIRNLDSGLTLRSITQVLTKNPFSSIIEQARERADLLVAWNPQEHYTFSPQGGEIINSEFMEDRRQYLLTINNPGNETLLAVNLRLQFPYPVDQSQVARSEESDGVSFQPVSESISVRGGELMVTRRPLYKDYKLKIAQIRPLGLVEVMVVLNSWRDPRRKTVPQDQGGRYFVPDWGPTLTYICGNFNHLIGSEMIAEEFYAPFQLQEDKTVLLASPGPRPANLTERVGVE